MEKLTENKRKWIIQQFRTGRSVTQIAGIQKISRQQVYKLAARYKKEGTGAYKAKKSGRPPQEINLSFAKKVVALRNKTDYGSEKLHFVLRKNGFIDTYFGDPVPSRGGKAIKYYRITKLGIEAMTETKKMQDAMWQEFSASILQMK